MHSYVQKLTIGLFVFLLIVGCSESTTSSSSQITDNNQPTKIIVGSHGIDADIWQVIAKSDEAKSLNILIEVKSIEDGRRLNEATQSGEVDANAYQSWGYLKDFNKITNDSLVAIGSTYFEPMGIYSDKIKSLDEIENGMIVAIPNDIANQSRALFLLERAELITLPENFNQATGSVRDITSNPYELKFKEIKHEQVPRALKDVDFATIGNALAQLADLNVLEDAIFYEDVHAPLDNTVNLIVVKKGNENNPELLKLNELFHIDDVKNYIDEQVGGTKVMIDIPVSSLR